MYLRRTTQMGLALLLAAGPGVCANAAAGQSKSTSNKSAAKPSASSSSSKKRGSSRKVSSRKKDRGQTAPTAGRISEIQQALAKDGSFSGTASGKWDDSTVEAMKNFQTTHGLNPTGKLDALTLQKLGLGSQTAGIAAPTPPPNATSRLSSAYGQSARQ
jgi:peptidoglycan hydrolase-like protein with peptidoglycan-binding domain